MISKWLGRLGLCGIAFTATALFAAPITGYTLEINNASPAVTIVVAAAVALAYCGVFFGSHVLYERHRGRQS